VVDWDPGPNAQQTSEGLKARGRELAERPGDVERQEGNYARALGRASTIVEATYDTPSWTTPPWSP
jgi:hypothetical protein